MFKYVIKRVLMMIPVVIGVVFIVFTIERMAPGDPVVSILGANYTQEQYDTVSKDLGLDKPYVAQLIDYYVGIFTRFDFGTSYTNKVPVARQILERFPTTLTLGLIGIIITVALGIPIGIISATRQYSSIDYVTTIVSLIFSGMPNFWLAVLLMLVFSAKLGWLPASGLADWKSWVMPCLACGLQSVAVIARFTRSSMLEVVRQDYIYTARSKGLSEYKIITKHELKNSLIPVVTMLGMQFGGIIGGTVIIESIFSMPGLGTLLMAGIAARDYPVVQGCVLVLSLTICVINLFVDIIYGFIDPRIKAQYVAGSAKKTRNLEKRGGRPDAQTT